MATADDSMPAVLCTGLVKHYGEVKAVDGLDLMVRRGECFALLGPNGAGKTTTVEILEGLTPPDAGDVRVLGERWTGGARDHTLRERLGIQLQETRLAERLTVLETLRMFRSFYTRGRSVDEVIALVELEEKCDARVGRLSGGQRQRLALACSLVSAPELLFLDEPTTGLDPQARHNVWRVVEEFRAGGGTVLLTTHYMDEASRLCDRVAVIDHGRMIALGSPAELVASLSADQIVELRGDGEADREALRGLPGIEGLDARNGLLMLRVSDMAAALPALLAELDRQGIGLESLATHQPTLEDVFVHLTGRGLRDE